MKIKKYITAISIIHSGFTLENRKVHKKINSVTGIINEECMCVINLIGFYYKGVRRVTELNYFLETTSSLALRDDLRILTLTHYKSIPEYRPIKSLCGITLFFSIDFTAIQLDLFDDAMNDVPNFLLVHINFLLLLRCLFIDGFIAWLRSLTTVKQLYV